MTISRLKPVERGMKGQGVRRGLAEENKKSPLKLCQIVQKSGREAQGDMAKRVKKISRQRKKTEKLKKERYRRGNLAGFRTGEKKAWHPVAEDLVL